MQSLDDKIDKLKLAFDMHYYSKAIEEAKSIVLMIKRIDKRIKKQNKRGN